MSRQQRLFQRTEAAAIDEAVEIVNGAKEDHKPRKVFILYSGGNDSAVLLDVALRYLLATEVVHVNTGTGFVETTEHVHRVMTDLAFGFRIPTSDNGRVFHELHPPKSYEEVFINHPIINGLPGPGMHHIAYNRLKERPLREFVQRNKRPFPIGWHDRIMFLTGVRADESRVRMGYKDSVVDREGATVWVNPLYHWTNDEMADYRLAHQLPVNPISEHLHISGECCCGAFARPDELEEYRFFCPAQAARIEGWQEQAKAKGLKYWRWGERRPDTKDAPARLCAQCAGQMDMFAAVPSPSGGTE